MKRGFVLPFIAMGIFAAAPFANGQAYTATVLYSLAFPSGYGSGTIYEISANQSVGYGLGSATGGVAHALLWSASGTLDLNPTTLSGITASQALGDAGAEQVGFGSGSGLQGNALLWTGSAGTVVNLNPSNFTFSSASATNGSQQVGDGSGTTTGGSKHALLWNATAASAVDLNPTLLSGFTTSLADGTNGSAQVGYGSGTGTSGNNHALLWNSTAASAVDLNPTNISSITSSEALAVAGTQQTGWGYASSFGLDQFGNHATHAMLWTGAANSAIDLNPTNLSGFILSDALDTNGTTQVGSGYGPGTSGDSHALAWTGSANSAVDLNAFLPFTDTWLAAGADDIDSSGNIFGTASDTSGNNFAVEWSPVPEPSPLGLLATLGIGALASGRQLRCRQLQ